MVRFLRLFRPPSPFGLLLAMVLALGLAAGEAVAQAPDTKKPALFPPYPEVWGRPLPMEEWMVDLSSVEIEEQADGEIVIHFGGGGTAGWVKFFSGETFVSTAVNDQRNPKRREGPNKVYQRITLSDGRRVNSRAHNYDEEGCYDGFNVTLSAPQPSKTTGAWTTKIIYVLHYRETPREPPYTEDCARQEKTDPFEEWVFSLPFHLHALKDGTFIAASGEGKVIIRFKPDLTSPYIDDDRFFAIDSATFREAYISVARHTARLKPVHDVVRIYLDALRDYLKRRKNWR